MSTSIATASNVNNIVDVALYPLDSSAFRDQCKAMLDKSGVLMLPEFVLPGAVQAIKQEGETRQQHAFYTSSKHNVYLQANDDSKAADHPRNRSITSSKGCITSDQIPNESSLHTLYNSTEFQQFLCAVLDQQALYEYADPLSSINLHYAADGQELGWHFDNSSFAITLLIQKPKAGGVFEYVKNARRSDENEMNYPLVEQILDGELTPSALAMDEGALVLFRGRDSMHRVTPTEGDTTRMLVVLAYNTQPGIALSEPARRTFYGR
ncbi:MAG: hypothetical protein V3U65_11640 [Granulosicoccaceae bacterium]